jgi:hypothetical protein
VTATVFLELAATREDLLNIAAWNVSAGQAQRGGASCDFAHRILTVPLGSTQVDRVVRAHELLHLRLSPPTGSDPHEHGVSARALECAEELRINWVLAQLGFDATILRDGSEKTSGIRVAESGAWQEAVCFYVALIGTGGEKEFLAGIRTLEPTWPKALRALRKEVMTIVDRTALSAATATPRDAELSGFELLTVPIARLADRAAGAHAPRDDDSWRSYRRSLSPGGRRAPSRRFAELVIDESLEYVAVSGRVGGVGTRYDVVGKAAAHPSREWRDPQRRIFERRRRRPGGVVLIDQSGSMDIADSDLDALLSAVPGVTVLGYSHRPGDQLAQPNAWVLATANSRARQLPTGNVGNGVDGPALAWALQHCGATERLVWVTDGQVTDSNDHPNEALTQECATLVVRHQIRLVRTLPEAAKVLSSPGLRPVSLGEFGRIGRKLGTFGFVS